MGPSPCKPYKWTTTCRLLSRGMRVGGYPRSNVRGVVSTHPLKGTEDQTCTPCYHEQNDWQTPVKTLPFPQLLSRTVLNSLKFLRTFQMIINDTNCNFRPVVITQFCAFPRHPKVSDLQYVRTCHKYVSCSEISVQNLKLNFSGLTKIPEFFGFFSLFFFLFLN